MTDYLDHFLGPRDKGPRPSGNGNYEDEVFPLADWHLQDIIHIQNAVRREFGVEISEKGAWTLWSDYSGYLYAAGWLIGCCPKMSVRYALEELEYIFRGKSPEEILREEYLDGNES